MFMFLVWSDAGSRTTVIEKFLAPEFSFEVLNFKANSHIPRRRVPPHIAVLKSINRSFSIFLTRCMVAIKRMSVEF